VSENNTKMNFVKGKNYRRVDLHEKYGGRRYSGISNCPKFPIIFIFSGKTGKQHGYEDGWDDDNYFWYSGEGQIGDMTFDYGNKILLNHQNLGKKIFLFENSNQSGYWTFIDELKLVNYEYYMCPDREGNQRKGIKFKLISIEKENQIETKNSISNDSIVHYNYNKPNRTERKGLVTSRIGQGYYRQQILEKWNNKCSVTGCETTEILISSHIVPWKDCNDQERLDVGNGILLSPNLDSLFDKHFISFQDTGEIMISDSLSDDDLDSLGVDSKMKLESVTDDMKSYLSRHREVFNEKN